MNANHRAQPQLMTLGILNHYVAEYGHLPRVTELAKLRHMTVKSIRLHMLYLEREGYIIHLGYAWHEIGITEKGMNAA